MMDDGFINHKSINYAVQPTAMYKHLITIKIKKNCSSEIINLIT